MHVATSLMGRRTKTNQSTGCWEPKRASKLHAQTRNAAVWSSYIEIISKLKCMSRENSNPKTAPELLTEVRGKENRDKRCRDVFSIHQENKCALSCGAGSDRCDVQT